MTTGRIIADGIATWIIHYHVLDWLEQTDAFTICTPGSYACLRAYNGVCGRNSKLVGCAEKLIAPPPAKKATHEEG